MKKKLLPLLLALALALSLAAPALADYSDLEGHWAKTYMEDLAERGYLKGYDDGTMRPDGGITAGETLAVLSRLYSLTDGEKELIYSDYGDYVAANVSSDYSWEYSELSVCLAAGIVTKDELKDLSLGDKIEKERLAVFVVRAMKREKAALALKDVELSYTDEADISSGCRNYVFVLTDAGIIKGDDANKFLPHSGVTRAVAATIVSRALAVLEKAGTTLTVEGYSGAERTEGVVFSAGSDVLRIRTAAGLVREYAVASDTAVTVDGAEKTLSSAYAGYYAAVTSKDGMLTKAALTGGDDPSWKQGVFVSYDSSEATTYVYLNDADTGAKTKYAADSGMSVSRDGAEAALADVKAGDFVTLRIAGGAASSLEAEDGEQTVSGSVSSISYGTTVALKVAGDGGETWYFGLAMSDLPEITRGGAAVTIDRLAVGDKVKIIAEDGAASSIEMQADENTVTGTLVSTTTTADGTKWVIRDSAGEERSFSVDAGAAAYRNGKSILISGIAVGETVTVTVYGGTITEIKAESAVSSVTKISGTVLAVDAKAHTITILSSGRLVYISTVSTAAMIVASTGKSTVLSAIAADSVLTAYGAYGSSSAFAAVTVIIES